MSLIKNKTALNLILIFSIFALTAAYFVQYVLGHKPCNLCLIERIPYIVAIIFISLIFLSYLFSNVAVLGVSPTIYVLLLIALSLIFIESKIGFIIFIYIVLYPLGDILPGEAILLSGINIIEIVSLILVLKYFMNFRELKFPKIFLQ